MRRAGPLTLAAVAALATAASARTPDAAPYRLSGMRAQLFFSDRGALSANILGDTTLALWNTPIGEGSAGGPSTSTLVVVEVAGEAGAYEADRSVELTATAGTRVLLRRTQSLGVLSEAGRAYVAFLVYDTGCEPVRLSARLVGQTQAAARTAQVPFECGE